MKNILVVGGSGFLGSRLVEKLCAKGYAVNALVRPNSDTNFLKSFNIGLRSGDLLDPESLKRALEGIDTVFCLVNVKPHGRSPVDYKKQLYLLHIDGTKNLISACKTRNIKRLIYLSSVAAIGYKKYMSTYDELSETTPLDDYGKVKLEAENILNQSVKNKELDITILRPPGVYGERGLGPLGKIIFFAGKGFLPIIGSGKNRQSLSYAGNVVNQAIFLADNQNAIGKTYIASDERPYTVNELVDAVLEAMGRRPFKIYIPIWLIITCVYIANCLTKIFLRKELINMESIIAITTERIFDGSRIFRELNYKQEYDLAAGIIRTIRWYKNA